MILIGVAYALFASVIWTSITYVVKQKHLVKLSINEGARLSES